MCSRTIGFIQWQCHSSYLKLLMKSTSLAQIMANHRNFIKSIQDAGPLWLEKSAFRLLRLTSKLALYTLTVCAAWNCHSIQAAGL